MKDSISNTEKWQTVLENRFKKIHFILLKLQSGFRAEVVHDFRVEIKKLKTILRLFGSAVKIPSIYRFPKRLNQCYRYLGHIREWQIQHQKISEVCGERKVNQPLIYLDRINRKNKRYTQKARRCLQKLSSLEKNQERIKKHFSEMPSPSGIQTFIDSKMQTLGELLGEKTQNDESMHTMRKLLKDVQYTLSYKEKKGNKDDRSPRLKIIKAVTQTLGEFHDLRVAMSLLDQELKAHDKTEEEKKLLQEIRNQWQPQKEKLRQEAKVKCLNLLHPEHG